MNEVGSVTNTAHCSKTTLQPPYKNAVSATRLSWTRQGMRGISFLESRLWGKSSFYEIPDDTIPKTVI